jgi:hypothetical protein
MTQDLKSLILSVNNWQSKTEEQVLAILSANTELYVDDSWWSLLGIASVVGDSEMPSVIQLLESVGLGWAVSQAAGRGVPLGDAAINAKLRLLADPRMDALADATRRNISVLNKNGLVVDVEDVSNAIDELKLEERRNALKNSGALRWNNFCHAVDLWDGSDPQPEL